MNICLNIWEYLNSSDIFFGFLTQLHYGHSCHYGNFAFDQFRQISVYRFFKNREIFVSHILRQRINWHSFVFVKQLLPINDGSPNFGNLKPLYHTCGSGCHCCHCCHSYVCRLCVQAKSWRKIFVCVLSFSVHFSATEMSETRVPSSSAYVLFYELASSSSSASFNQ